ncbi:MAG: sensor histidine kinase [Holdemania filiformis]
MKILVDSKIKHLFYTVALIFFSFLLLSFFLFTLDITQTAGISLILFLMTGIAVVGVMFLYFNDQYKTMENAISQIKDYTAGNPAARIECDKEGELNRLFHEVNALVAILNAHAENEERAKRFMKDTLSDISHQLKTPLAALNIYNGIIQQEAGDAESIQEFAALSEQELERIETLVQNLLKITKLDAGTIVLEKTVENVSELMAQIERRFAFQACQEGKTLTFSGDESLTLLCDRTWLTEAVGNLLKMPSTTRKPATALRPMEKPGPLVQLVVQDNGCGIHPKISIISSSAFTGAVFQRIPRASDWDYLCKAIVEAHSGTIEVDSTLGIGTTFTINFLIPTKL